jgi:protoheme IX farnesyltransferase
MLLYAVLLLPVAVAPALLGIAGLLYAAAAVVLGLIFVGMALAVLREDGAATGHRAAKRMFAFSILYLFLLFALLIVDRAPGLMGGLMGGVL